MATLTSAEKAALLWPIKAKGAVTRFKPLGDPQVEHFYHNAMEQGRFLETSIADANNWLLQKKTLLINQIETYTHMNNLAVDGQLGHIPRVPKYIADSLSILQTAQRFEQEIVSLVEAIQQNITQIIAIEQSMLNMVQTANNSLANLLNNICNWGIPGLPSIPNLFPDSLWNWNGFLFSPLALFAAIKANTNFDFNFTFANCSFGPSSTSNLFVTNPLTTQTYSGLVYGSANYDPPNNGVITPAAQDLTSPVFVAQMQGTLGTPVYNPAFNPNTQMFGAVADPHQVISNWQMPAATYTADIVSICPQLRTNTVFVTDADYSNPNLTVRTPALSKALAHNINLAQIVTSNYDPFVVSAWLLYLNAARNGRGGVWIPNFEAVYATQLQPSIGDLLTLSVPWNDVLPGTDNVLWMGSWDTVTAYVINDVVVFGSVNYIAIADSTNVTPGTSPLTWVAAPAGNVYSDAPVIQFITALQTLPTQQRLHLLWQLSYIEASLLGYSRNRTWDANQDNTFLSGPTGADLDYTPTALTVALSSLILGQGTAEFPVPITFPSVIKTVMDKVVAIATINIENDPAYLSPRLGNRFTYNQFAQATQVDRFSQFWRDFATNLTNFLAQDPFLVQFAVTYPQILDGALDPLASAADAAAYASLLADVAARNRSWQQGTPLLNIPVQPVTSLAGTPQPPPNVNTNGWVLPPTDLDPVAFLARPDIIVLPIPVQIAMLRTNLSYAGLNTFAAAFQAEVATQIATANGIINATSFGSITATSITTNVLTVTAQNNFNIGDNVQLTGTQEAFLNNQVVTVITASSTGFTAAFINPDYSNPADTGIAWLSTPTGATSDSEFVTDVAVNTPNLEDSYAARVQGTGHVAPTNPRLISTIPGSGTNPVYFSPIPDGITTTAQPVVGQPIGVLTTYGESVQLPTAISWTVGGLLYVHAGPLNFGLLTQSFTTVIGELALLTPAPAPITATAIGFTTVTQTTTAPTAPFTATTTAPVAAFLTPPAVTPGTANAVTSVTDNLANAVTSVTDNLVNISNNILTVTCANTFAVGDFVLLSGLTTSTFLNGQVVKVLTRTPTQFTCDFAHDWYVTVAEAAGATAATATGWLMSVGRVTAYDALNNLVTFIYEPHLPILHPQRAASV